MNLVPLAYGDQHALQKQALFLYDLLKERDPVANISHREVPPFWKHLEFINSRPYAVWNIIERPILRHKSAGGLTWAPIGSIYLTEQNEIGMFLKKEAQYKGWGRKAIKLFMAENPRPAYLANISPENVYSQRFFHGLGFKCVQFTYQWEAECAD